MPTRLRGANSPLPHCGQPHPIRPVPVLYLRGANSPLPHCGTDPADRCPAPPPPTRGEFAPPSLRPTGGLGGRPVVLHYEGRIRPSLIAATAPPPPPPPTTSLRGANSPLPHCGGHIPQQRTPSLRPTRGEFAPPSLRHLRFPGISEKMSATRGEFAPPSLRRGNGVLPAGGHRATRGEFAPPSLRPTLKPFPGLPPPPTRGEFAPPSLRPGPGDGRPLPPPLYEGRIRPSLIAAPVLRRRVNADSRLRGANSPLPHCGYDKSAKSHYRERATRGEFAPPSLRLWYKLLEFVRRKTTRGEFAPPSLRPAEKTTTTCR